jgi:hypothetical protein
MKLTMNIGQTCQLWLLILRNLHNDDYLYIKRSFLGLSAVFREREHEYAAYASFTGTKLVT